MISLFIFHRNPTSRYLKLNIFTKERLNTWSTFQNSSVLAYVNIIPEETRIKFQEYSMNLFLSKSKHYNKKRNVKSRAIPITRNLLFSNLCTNIRVQLKNRRQWAFLQLQLTSLSRSLPDLPPYFRTCPYDIISTAPTLLWTC